MEFKDVTKECETCEYLYTRKDHMPCSKCRLNKMYISHWKVHPAIARAFGEPIEHQKPIFHTNKKKIEEAVKKTNESLDKGITLPEAMEQLYEDLGQSKPENPSLYWTAPVPVEANNLIVNFDSAAQDYFDKKLHEEGFLSSSFVAQEMYKDDLKEENDGISEENEDQTI